MSIGDTLLTIWYLGDNCHGFTYLQVNWSLGSGLTLCCLKHLLWDHILCVLYTAIVLHLSDYCNVARCPTMHNNSSFQIIIILNHICNFFDYSKDFTASSCWNFFAPKSCHQLLVWWKENLLLYVLSYTLACVFFFFLFGFVFLLFCSFFS